MDENNHSIVELDVRPHLRKKLEPFQMIMDTVKNLRDEDIFVLHATFKPTPLFGVLKMRGYVNKAENFEKDHWVVTFVKKKYKHLLDDSEKNTEEAVDLGVVEGSDSFNQQHPNSKIHPIN